MLLCIYGNVDDDYDGNVRIVWVALRSPVRAPSADTVAMTIPVVVVRAFAVSIMGVVL